MTMLLAAAPCFATLQSPNDAPVATKYKTSCRVNADLSEDCVSSWRHEILTSAGRDLLSQLSLPAQSNQTISALEAYVVKRDGTRLRLPDGQIAKKPGTGPEQGIDNSTTTVLLFQGLEVGGAVEYSMKDHTKAARGASRFYQSASFEPSPQRYDSIHIEYAAGQPILWRGEDLQDFDVKASDGGKKVTIDLAKPRYFYPLNEEGLTARTFPRIALSTSDKLEDHYEKLVGIYNKILSSPLPHQAAAEVERLKDKPREEQIKALVKFLSAHYRYLADYRLDNRGLIPLEPAQTEKNGYGDCKDLTVLLAAMLRGLGIDAEPAFVVRGDYAPALLIPSLSAPNHAIVRAVVDGKVWWIDATNPILLPGYTPADLQDRWTIVAGKDGKARLETIPPAELVIVQSTSQSTRFHPDGTSDVESSTKFDGEKLLSFMAYQQSNGTSATDQMLCEGDQKCTVSRAALDEAKPPYVVKMHQPDQPATTKSEGFYKGELGSFFLPNLDAFKNYRKTGGVSDYNLGSPMIRQLSGKVSGIRLRQPLKSCHVRSRWFDYDADIRPELDGASYTLRATEKVAWIDHAELASDAFGKFLREAEDCFEGLGYSYTTDSPAPQTAP